MSAAPWTPGSWRVVEEDDAIAHWYRVEVGTPPRRVFKMSDAADARLIAAAPEMAALLADFVAWDEARSTDIDHGELKYVNAARALLARIRGETP